MGKRKKRRPRRPPAQVAVRAVTVRNSPPPWTVLWHPDAEEEMGRIQAGDERVAIDHCVDKLEAEGIRLGFPHSSSVQGVADRSIRELRPRQGASPWRPIYRRVGEAEFVILAVGPEANVDKAGYATAVAAAEERARGLGQGPIANPATP